jgi:hypothetical protein
MRESSFLLTSCCCLSSRLAALRKLEQRRYENECKTAENEKRIPENLHIS